MHTPTYGDFGNLHDAYARGRKEFPAEVFDLLWDALQVPPQEARMLDVGCGTGIATRQLAGYGALICATDRDELMVGAAKQEVDMAIDYRVAPTNSLPFPAHSFDGVTAFSAFHWFTDIDSVNEIRRVLRPGGIFCVVNKNDVAGLKLQYHSFLASYIDHPLPNAKEYYDPAEVLRLHDFVDVSQEIIRIEEHYTPTEAATYLQSVSLWNLIPIELRESAKDALVDWCVSLAGTHPYLTRVLDVPVVVGRKSE